MKIKQKTIEIDFPSYDGDLEMWKSLIQILEKNLKCPYFPKFEQCKKIDCMYLSTRNGNYSCSLRNLYGECRSYAYLIKKR